MSENSQDRRHRFGDFELNCETSQLLRDSQPIKIQPQPLRILQLLVERSGQTVSREELRHHIWNGSTFVEFDQGLNYCIRQIRRALDDDASSPTYIETLPKQGYRFIADVAVDDWNAKVVPVESPSPIKLSATPAPVPSPFARRGALFVAAAILTLVFAGVAVTLYLSLRPPPRAIPIANSRYIQLTDFTDSASGPVLSPDGRMLAFFRGGDGFFASNQLYVKILPNGKAERLTNDLRWKYGPAFSPDGSEIAYTVIDGKTFETKTVPVLGGESHPLLENAAGLTWLGPDQVLFSRLRTGLHMGVVTGTLSTRQFRDLYFPDQEEEMAMYSYVSPDHRVALALQMGGDEGGWGRCRLISLEGLFAARLVGPKGVCSAAAWSKDGSWMYFTVETDGKFHLWRQAYPNGAPEQLTSGPFEEEGLAVGPEGHSLITSMGKRETSLWLHEPRGDRPLVMEGDILGGRLGEAYPPSFSNDGRFLYYLFRPEADSQPELWRVNVASGKSEAVFPGVAMHDYNISLDGKRVLYSTTSPSGVTELCTESLDQKSAPRRVAVPGAVTPRFGTPGKLFFFRVEGSKKYLESVNEDGSGAQRVIPYPIFDSVELSPARRWLLTAVAVPHAEPQLTAISLRGDAPQVYCGMPCYPAWSPNGKWLFIPLEHASGSNPGRTLAIPVAPGEKLPKFPEGGLNPKSQTFDIPGSRLVSRDWPIPSNDPSRYAYLNSSMHRNLYRIQLP